MSSSDGQSTEPCRPAAPQRQEGHTQRFIREVNTTSRSCVLWDLEEETDYIIQVQSIGLYGESQASKKVHFRTLKKSDRFPSNSSNQGGCLTCGAATGLTVLLFRRDRWAVRPEIIFCLIESFKRVSAEESVIDCVPERCTACSRYAAAAPPALLISLCYVIKPLCF